VGCSNGIMSFTVFYLCYNWWHPAAFALETLGETGERVSQFLRGGGVDSVEGAFANVVSYAFGMANSFVWNKIWTFGIRYQTGIQMMRFIIVNIFGLIASTISIFILVDVLNFPSAMVWWIIMSVITCMNFVCYKYWAFGEGSIESKCMQEAHGVLASGGRS